MRTITERAAVRAAAAGTLLAAAAGCGSLPSGDAPARAEPTVQETSQGTGEPEAEGAPDTDLPVAVGLDLFVGGAQVPGRWFTAEGRGTHWVALRDDRTWWWGFDDEPRPIDGRIDQSVVISPGGGYTAHVEAEPGGRWRLVGADTEFAGEGFGAVDLPRGPIDPPPRAVAVTDDGLVVAGGPDFQWLWRPLVDNAVVDLAETAPGQVVLRGTDAGLIVNAGTTYGQTDETSGAPYLARLAPDGTLTRLGPVPTHDVLEAGEQWLAYVPPGSIGGEAWTTTDLHVQRRDGSGPDVIDAPDGWRFAVPGFRWETADQLLALLVSPDESTQALARCRPDTRACEVIHTAG